jgi:hypothetical protein
MEAEGYSERLPVGQELYRAAMEGRGRRFADLGDVMRNENPQEAGEERRRREEAVGAARRQAEEERRREAAAPPPPRLPAPDAYGGDNGWDAYPDRTVLMMSGRGNIDRLDPRDIAALYNRNMGMLSSGTMDGRPLTDEQRERLRANNRYMMQAYQMRMAERENAGRAEGRRAAATAGREQGREDREELIRRRTEEREDLIRRSGLFEESPERAPLDRFYELLRGHNGDLFEEPKKTEEPEEAAELEAERGGSVGPLAIALPVLMGATAGMMALPDGRRHRPSRTITAERREASRVRRGQQEAVRDRVRREREAFRADDRGTVRIDLRRIEREMREVERRRRAEDHAARQRAEHEAAVARNDERIRARRELNVRRRTEQGEAGDRVRRERAAFRADDRGTMRIRQGRQEGEPARATAGDRGLMGHLRVERGREAQAERDAADAGLRRAIAAAPVSPEEAREAARGYPIPQRVSRTADVTFRRPRTDYSREQLRLLRDAAFNERLVRSGLARGSRNLEFEHLSDQDLMNIGLGLE